MPVAEPKLLLDKSAPRGTGMAHANQQVMPPFGAMIKLAAIVNAVPIALFLTAKHVWPALGILSGFVLGLAMGGLLYGFINYGLSLFVPSSVSQGQAQSAGQIGGFAALMVGKFLLIGALLFVVVVVLKLSILWMVTGFLLTQTTMIWMTVSRLAKTKVTD